ncbi:response regulator [Pedobacter sp. UBA4863]|uniref:response regulator n=1 Tax=Pedobacter sp. UBA4863 TaxID=1947060 RepID=UPI0025E5E8DE|nr:response regulator [Pedobacter sp. UBA4863]
MQPANSSTINLLVIDDDDINIFIISKIVEKTGYPVEICAKHNGQLAIDYIKDLVANNQPLPQLTLIDINMPILNGWEFIEAYEAMQLNAKNDMYMLSSSVYENDIEKAKGYQSVKGFISKPLSIDRLKELLAEVTS